LFPTRKAASYSCSSYYCLRKIVLITLRVGRHHSHKYELESGNNNFSTSCPL